MKIYNGVCQDNVITRMALHPFDGPPLACGDKPRKRWNFRVVFRWHSSNDNDPWFISCRGEQDRSQSACRQFNTDDEAIAWLMGGER